MRPIWTVTGDDSRQRAARRRRDRRQPSRRLDLWRRRSLERVGCADGARADARRADARRMAAESDSILFASWDAEEFTLTSSTEWGEQHAARLRGDAVAYLNVDSAASGPNFTATAVPALNRLIGEAAHARPRSGSTDSPSPRPPAIGVARARRAADRLDRRAGRQPAGQRIRLHGLPESPGCSGRGPLVRRPVRRVSLDLRQP